MAKKRPALEVKTIGQIQLEQRCMREGEIYISGTGSGETGLLWSGETGGGFGAGSVATPNIKALYLKTMSISVNMECYGQLLLGQLVFANGGGTIGSSAVQSGTLNIKDNITLDANILIKKDRQFPEFRINTIIPLSPTINVASGMDATNRAFAVTKLRNSGTANSGVFTYTVTVTNNSGSNSSGLITIIETLPNDLEYVSATGSGWTFNSNQQVLTITTNDVINNNSNKIFTVTVRVKKRLLSGMSGIGYIVDNDINLDAPAIWWNGTSITAGSGILNYKDSYTYIIRNFVRDELGIPNRIVNRAIGGSSSSTQDRLLKFDNRYDPIEIPLAFIFEHGINDSAQSVPVQTTLDNFKSYLDNARRIDSRIPVICLAPFPTQNPTNESLNSVLSTSLMNYIDNTLRLTDLNVWFVQGTRTIFNPVTESGTYTTDGIHLNPAGNLLVSNVVTAFFEDNNIFNN